MDLAEQLLDTWRIHNRINLYLLDAISQESLQCVAAPRGWNVGEQFSHLHTVRLLWMKVAAPALHERFEKIEKERRGDKELLRASLEASGEGVEEMLRAALAGSGKIKGFKPHASAFIGYLISHESHHRGQIMLTLKQAGHKVDQKTQFGLWEWGVR